MPMLLRAPFVLLLAVVFSCADAHVLGADEPRVIPDVAYLPGDEPDLARRERCRLDLYLPSEGRGFATVVWLHGGGLTGGSKSTELGKRVARRLAELGVAVAMAEYRLNPAARFPNYVGDAAAAFAWVRANIASRGGDPARVLIGGHSAGGYLAMMVGLDASYLAAKGLGPDALAGVVAVSAQMSTHFTVREERGLGDRLVVDDAAPLYHVARRSFPFLILCAGEDLPLRREENQLMVAGLHEAGTPVEARVFEGRNHASIFSRMGDAEDAVAALVVRFSNRARAAR
jgi:acetyl esterase/lipase